jgi:ribose 5-phosphate isomerase B
VPGVRAATCHDVYSAERSRKSNNCQILTMGARVVGVEVAKTVVRPGWPQNLKGRPTAKVQRMIEIDEMFHGKRDASQEGGSCSV